MLVPILIGAGLLGLLLLNKKDGNAPPAFPAQLPSPPPPFVPGTVQPVITPVSAPAASPSASPPLQRARVTTNDPPPSGDLIMRTGPSDSALQVPGGGAEKDGIVTVVNMNASPDGVWAEIDWPGGSRRPEAKGFAKKQFLTVLV